jgi:uncharacterized protein (TIGR02217 family)
VSENFNYASVTITGILGTDFTRFTRVTANVFGASLHAPLRATRVNVSFVSGFPAPLMRMTRVTARIIATRTNTFEYTQMVYPDVFPDNISYNSIGSIRFATDVTIVDSGDDQRVSRWDQPLQEYDVSYGVRTMEQLTALITLFRAMKGRLYAFCYQDWLDYSSSSAVAYEARKAPPTTAFDQLIGTGDSATKVFQLVKTYAASATSNVRPITRPQPGTVKIGINGGNTTNFTVDDTTGLVTMTTPLSVTIPGNCSKNVADGTSHICTFSAAAGTFFPFIAFNNYQCVIENWANEVDNTTEANVTMIGAVSGDGSTMEVTYPANYGTAAESDVEGVTIYVHPAPKVGQAITAGYLFYVPVRFDTDTLPVTLENYGVGSSTSVKLIEVRSSDPS